jgi:hypothetical protein
MIEVEHEPMKQYILKERRSGKALEVVGGQ